MMVATRTQARPGGGCAHCPSHLVWPRPALLLYADHFIGAALAEALEQRLQAPVALAHSVHDVPAALRHLHPFTPVWLISGRWLGDACGVRAAARLARQIPGCRPLTLEMEGEGPRLIDGVLCLGGESCLLTALYWLQRGLLGAPRPMAGREADGNPAGLTARELAVAMAVAEGQSNLEIARQLRIGAGTVKTHIARSLAKLGGEGAPSSPPTSASCAGPPPAPAAPRPAGCSRCPICPGPAAEVDEPGPRPGETGR